MVRLLGLALILATIMGPGASQGATQDTLPAEVIPTPDGDYLDTSDWTFATTTKQDVRVLMKKLLNR